MSTERKTGTQEQGIERLGRPDYTGEWTGNVPGTFKLWVLTRIPWTIDCSVLPGMGFVDGFVKAGEVVEGLMQDRVGLSVVSGTITPESIMLVKRYSNAAREKGGYENIVYRATLNVETGEFSGTYEVTGTQLTGAISIRPTVASVV